MINPPTVSRYLEIKNAFHAFSGCESDGDEEVRAVAVLPGQRGEYGAQGTNFKITYHLNSQIFLFPHMDFSRGVMIPDLETDFQLFENS